MKNKKPFFSIVIPTYNRCNFLKANISILLEQTFDDFEIVVSDNLSTDKTEKTVASFKDKRIRYFKNKKNLGFIGNSQKAILRAKGKYIFTLGDDDFVLFPDTLAYLKKLLNKEKYGFIRLNFLERKFYGKGLQKIYRDVNEDLIIDKGTEAIEILDFFEKIHIGHIAGLVYKNENITEKNFINSEASPWMRIAFENTKKHGAFFLSSYYIVITLARVNSIYSIYEVIDNKKLMYEYYIDNISDTMSNKEFKEYRQKYYRMFIPLLPCIKYYSNNSNLWKFVKRLIKIEESLKFDFKLWLYFLISFMIPKSVWEIIKRFQHKFSDKINNIKNLKKVLERFEYLDKKYYGFLQNNC